MENKEKKQGLFGKLVGFMYSGKHPQQKYYKGLYNQTNEREKGLEVERTNRDEKNKQDYQ